MAIAVPAAIAALPPAPAWLPPNTLAWVTVPDCQRFRQDWQTLAVVRLWKDPAFRAATRHFQKAWTEQVSQRIQEQWAVSWAELATWMQGQLTWALVERQTDPHTGPSRGSILMLEVGEQADRVQQHLTRLQQRWASAGRSVRTETVRDTRFVVLALPGGNWWETLHAALQERIEPAALEELDDGSRPVRQRQLAPFELAVGVNGQALWMSDSLALLEEVLGRMQGGSEGAFQSTGRVDPREWEPLPRSMLFAWIDVARWYRRSSPAAGSDLSPGSAEPSVWEVLGRVIGLSAAQSLTLAVLATPQDWQVEMVLRVPMDKRGRLLSLLEFLPLESGPPDWLPPDWLRFYRFRISGTRAWSELEKAAMEASPVWQRLWTFLTETMEQAGRQRDSDFHLQRDLVALLGDDWIYWQTMPRGPGWASLENAPALWLIASPEPHRLAESIVTVLAGAALRSDALTHREFLGRTIFSVPRLVGSIPASPDHSPPQVHIAATERYVGITSEPALLEDWLRSLGAPRQPSGRLPAGPGLGEPAALSRGWLGYENYAAIARHCLQAIQTDPEHLGQARLPGPLGFRLQLHMPPERWRPWLDPELLPPWDAWQRYIGVGVWRGSAHTESVRLTFSVRTQR